MTTITLAVDKSTKGLGFSLIGGEEGSTGVYASNVLEGGAMGDAGIQTGDLFLVVNGHQVQNATHDEVVGFLNAAPEKFSVTIQRSESKKEFIEASSSNEGNKNEASEIIELKDRSTEARKAFKSGDASLSKYVHDKAPEKHQTESGQYVKAIVFGAMDGIITTFSVVASVSGANLSLAVVLILGFANLIGDGVSMAMGEYLSEVSEEKYAMHEKEREIWEFEKFPEGEIEEMVAIYKERGVEEADARKILKTMAKYKNFFVDHMMVEELEVFPPGDGTGHWKSALVIFLAFCGFGLIPLIAYIALYTVNVSKGILFLIACVLTAVALFVLGVLRSRFCVESWYGSGIRVLLSGAFSACVAWIVGYALSFIVDSNC